MFEFFVVMSTMYRFSIGWYTYLHHNDAHKRETQGETTVGVRMQQQRTIHANKRKKNCTTTTHTSGRRSVRQQTVGVRVQERERNNRMVFVPKEEDDNCK
jgi:hypothetical protein